jgi:hypothetical protein
MSRFQCEQNHVADILSKLRVGTGLRLIDELAAENRLATPEGEPLERRLEDVAPRDVRVLAL